jgi:uncharacterized membrane protein
VPAIHSIHLVKFWDVLRTSYWFVPTIMSIGSTGLAFLMVEIDRRVQPEEVPGLEWAWTGSAEGARLVLSTVAGSMITVTGVSFSITIVALTLASSQFGPRLLRNFMRDTGNQLVLGTFVSTFLYCLLVLRTIRGLEEQRFVPHLSVTLGVVFALTSVGVLIYFIHHVSGSIQAEHLAASVAHELHESIDRLFPERLGRPEPEGGVDPRLLEDLDQEKAAVVESESSGYLQAVDERELLEIATACDLLLELRFRPGDFVTHDRVLVRIWPRERCGPAELDRVRDAFVFGQHRTPTQDVEYTVRQLAEIAVRALSPSINDPFTVTTCLDWLGSGLSRLAGRKIPSPLRTGPDGRLRVIADSTSFTSVADAAFHPIRQYGRSSVIVMIHFFEVIATVASDAKRPEDREALRRHAELAYRDAQQELPDMADRKQVEERYRGALRALAEAKTVEREKEEALRQAAQEAP